MPIEIRELVIKAYVEDAQGESGTATGNGSEKEEIIADCLEQISELLKDRLER